MIKHAMNERVDSEAIRLACRFAYGCNAVRLHPDKELMNKMKNCIISGEVSDLPKRLLEIPDLNVYTKTLAEITGLPQLSREVMEAYWLGNDLLNKVRSEHYELLLKNYEMENTNNPVLQVFKLSKPTFFLTHHAFSIFHTSLDPNELNNELNLETSRACMVRWGRISDIRYNEADVLMQSLSSENGSLKIVSKKALLEIDYDFIPGVKTGDQIAIHLGKMVKILSPLEAKNLEHWTTETLKRMF